MSGISPLAKSELYPRLTAEERTRKEYFQKQCALNLFGTGKPVHKRKICVLRSSTTRFSRKSEVDILAQQVGVIKNPEERLIDLKGESFFHYKNFLTVGKAILKEPWGDIIIIETQEELVLPMEKQFSSIAFLAKRVEFDKVIFIDFYNSVSSQKAYEISKRATPKILHERFTWRSLALCQSFTSRSLVYYFESSSSEQVKVTQLVLNELVKRGFSIRGVL
ncbi:MAG TPA: hypothetical protein VGJ00_08510 [Rhabdochlamydiaceae bacterium]